MIYILEVLQTCDACPSVSAVQLVYDFKDGGGTLGLLSLHPDLIDKEEIEKFKKIGVNIPSMM